MPLADGSCKGGGHTTGHVAEPVVHNAMEVEKARLRSWMMEALSMVGLIGFDACSDKVGIMVDVAIELRPSRVLNEDLHTWRHVRKRH